jgi:hypothetical protein
MCLYIRWPRYMFPQRNLLEFIHGLVEGLGMAGQEDACSAVVGECFGYCEADATRAAGDECGFSRESCEGHASQEERIGAELRANLTLKAVICLDIIQEPGSIKSCGSRMDRRRPK